MSDETPSQQEETEKIRERREALLVALGTMVVDLRRGWEPTQCGNQFLDALDAYVEDRIAMGVKKILGDDTWKQA